MIRKCNFSSQVLFPAFSGVRDSTLFRGKRGLSSMIYNHTPDSQGEVRGFRERDQSFRPKDRRTVHCARCLLYSIPKCNGAFRAQEIERASLLTTRYFTGLLSFISTGCCVLFFFGSSCLQWPATERTAKRGWFLEEIFLAWRL